MKDKRLSKDTRVSKDHCLSKAKSISKDVISGLPEPILEAILCLVPIKDAVRTSILARNWRYTWTNIPKLVFDEKDMFDKIDDSDDENRVLWINNEPTQMTHMAGKAKVLNAIQQVLSLHRAPISEFALSTEADITCVNIEQIITYLSRNNTLKKFKLNLSCKSCCMPYMLSPSVFSLNQLTDLYLSECQLNFGPTFGGFGSLTSLYLNDVHFTRNTLVHLLSNCPLLKSVSMDLQWENVRGFNGLDLTIVMLLECLSLIEHLTICVGIVEFFVHDVFPQVLPTTLVHLKYFCLCEMTFASEYEIQFILLLIRSSPNLEKIKLQITRDDDPDPVSEICSDIWLEHLNELEIIDFSNANKYELDFVELILAKSPVLKKVKIFLDYEVTYDDEIVLLTTLSRSRCQSHMVEFSVEGYRRNYLWESS